MNTASAPALPAIAADPLASAEVRGLTLAYGKKNAEPVLRDLDWQLRPGQVVGLLGRNGAGKTTLLEALLGLREPQSGSCRLFGQPAPSIDDGVRARIGYVPQQADLFETLNARQLLAYFKSFYPRWNAAKVDGLMSRWEIPPEQAIGKLSGGQQQRLSIIRALAHDPDLLVLDEPVASLDPMARRDFLRELVEQVLERGTTVVFSTHILSDLERVAFDVAFLQAGRIALQAPLDELLDGTRAVSGDAARLSEFAAANGLQVLGRANRGKALLRGDWSAVPGVPAPLVAERVALDDLFEALT